MRASSLWQHSVRGVVARVFPDHSRITGQGHAYSVLRNLSLQGMITSGRLDFVVSARLSILGLFLGMLAFTSSASTVQSPTGPLPSMLPDIDERNEDSPGEAVIRLAESLINIESLSGSEHAMAHALKGWLSKRGWEVVLQPVPPALGHEEEGERWNVYAFRPGTGVARRDKGPKVLLNSHIDTVPPFYSATVDRQNGIIRGRGACDTKGILAAQLLAAQRLVESGQAADLGLLYVVSEETDHSGMKQANSLNLRPNFLLVGEPTGSKMIRSQKGLLKLRLLSHGVSCHSGYPSLGKSAIDPLVDALQDLKRAHWPKNEELGATTLNIGLLKGGHAANALAAEAEATLVFRLITPPEQVLETVRATVGDRADVEVITANTPVQLNTLEGYATDVACFNTDIAYFDLREPTAQAFLMGPGSILDAHSDHELIHIPELQRAVAYYEEILLRLLKGPRGSTQRVASQAAESVGASVVDARAL